MPHIDAALPAVALAQCDTSPDWNALPPELKAQVVQWLDAGDRARLADASKPWRDVVVSHAFDQAARSVLARREGLLPAACPTPQLRNATGLAGELRASGFDAAAQLVALHRTCEQLASVERHRAVYDTVPTVGLAGSTVFQPPEGEPAFLGLPHDGDDFVLLSRDGTQRCPRALVDATLLEAPRLVVVNSMLTAGAMDDACFMKGPTGKLFQFDTTHDALRSLPETFELPAGARVFAAAMSRDGRFVAAQYSPPNADDVHLVVHDREARGIVTRTTVPLPTRETISVDADGTVVIGGAHRYEARVGENAETIARKALPAGFVANQLSPDEQHIVCLHGRTLDIHLAHRADGTSLTLLSPPAIGSDPHRAARPCSIAFSAAMAMASVMRDDGSLAIYDLLNAPADARELQPTVHFALQNAKGPMLFFHFAATWFDRDGGGVHAAYPLATPETQFPGTGLMHLRFDTPETQR